MLKRWSHMKNILVFLLLLDAPNVRYSILSRIEFYNEFKDGMNNDYQKGTKILLKTVVQAIPNYLMSYFKILDSLLMDIQSMMSNFWQGDGNKTRQIHWISWDKLFTRKENWGMGFRQLKALILHYCLSKHSILLTSIQPSSLGI